MTNLASDADEGSRGTPPTGELGAAPPLAGVGIGASGGGAAKPPAPPPGEPEEAGEGGPGLPVVRPLSDFPPESFFRRERDFRALSVPARRTSEFRGTLKRLLRTSGKHVLPDPVDPKHRRLLVLREDLDDDNDDNDDEEDGEAATDVEEEERAGEPQAWTQCARRAARNLLAQHLACPSGAVLEATHREEVGYSDLSARQVLSQLLPPRPSGGGTSTSSNVPSAFETVGPIAHLNLPDHLLPYKYWIGKVLLDKNPAIRTVVNKVGAISNEYRVFQHEVLAGNSDEGWSIVTVKEGGCSFELDFAKVYWNSRLAGEHGRTVQRIRAQANAHSEERPYVVADLMAGVGPFAIPITSLVPPPYRRSNVVVYANDLNPDSYRYLVRNAARNKCRNLHCFNTDARAFVRDVLAKRGGAHEVLMNLPASAPEFLDAFRGYPRRGPAESAPPIPLPQMHVYCFAPKVEESTEYRSAVTRCETALGCPIGNAASVRTVRNVSPGKNMVCVTFVLPEEACYLPLINVSAGPEGCGCDGAGVDVAEPSDDADTAEPPAKRAKAAVEEN